MNKPNDHRHMPRVCAALRNAGGWLTNVEIAEAAGVAERTARKHTAKLAALGLVDMVNAYPSHQFKLRSPARLDRIGQTAMAELEKAISSGPIEATNPGRDFSEHKTQVYRVLKESAAWMTNVDIAEAVGIAERTARKHTLLLVQLGVIEHDMSAPAHTFRFNADILTKRAQDSVSRLDMAVKALESRQRAR